MFVRLALSTQVDTESDLVHKLEHIRLACIRLVHIQSAHIQLEHNDALVRIAKARNRWVHNVQVSNGVQASNDARAHLRLADNIQECITRVCQCIIALGTNQPCQRNHHNTRLS